MGVPEKIQAIKDELKKTKVNKATEHHVGLLKAKLAKLRREMEEIERSKGGGGASGGTFDVKKTGDVSVAIVGLPSVGKSTLLNQMTNARSKVASYSFTTLTVVPGMMEYKGARIQILDLPGIIKGAASGKGLGKRVLSVVRGVDLVLLMLDVFQPDHAPLLRKEMRDMGIRLDEKPPDIVIEKSITGGVEVNCLVPLKKISVELIKDILRLYDYNSARVVVREDLTDDQLIDVVSKNRAYIPSVTVLNKIDLVNEGFIKLLQSKIGTNFIAISADKKENIEMLKEAIYNKLDLIRIYLRPKGGETDYKEPFIITNGATVQDVCDKLHRDMTKEFKYALIWGKSVKFGGQKAGLGHRLADEDVLTIVKRR
jgi:uncharacterized protein